MSEQENDVSLEGHDALQTRDAREMNYRPNALRGDMIGPERIRVK